MGRIEADYKKLGEALNRIRTVVNSDNEEYIVMGLINVAQHNKYSDIELKGHLDNLTLEEAIKQVEEIYCDINFKKVLDGLDSLAHSYEADDSEFGDEEYDAQVLIDKLNGNTARKNVELLDRLEHLRYIMDEDNEQEVLLMLETIVNKFSPKNVLQHAMYTATRSVEGILTAIDSLVTYTEDEKAVEELFAYLDSAIENIELTEKSKSYDEKTRLRRLAGNHGHIMQVKRGNVYWCTLTTGVGHEMSGKRTVLIISKDNYNERADIVNVIAMDGEFTRPMFQEEIRNSDLYFGQLPSGKTSVAVSFAHILTIDKARLGNYQCRISFDKMKDIEVRVFKHLGMTLNNLKDNNGNYRVL